MPVSTFGGDLSSWCRPCADDLTLHVRCVPARRRPESSSLKETIQKEKGERGETRKRLREKGHALKTEVEGLLTEQRRRGERLSQAIRKSKQINLQYEVAADAFRAACEQIAATSAFVCSSLAPRPDAA